jgi:hypothetical protein
MGYQLWTSPITGYRRKGTHSIHPCLCGVAERLLLRAISAHFIMPLGMASVLTGLLAAVVIYAGWCGATSTAMKGLQFGLLMGVFAACIHALSNLVTMNMDLKLGLEITVGTFVGWVLAGIVIGLVYRPAIAAS